MSRYSRIYKVIALSSSQLLVAGCASTALVQNENEGKVTTKTIEKRLATNASPKRPSSGRSSRGAILFPTRDPLIRGEIHSELDRLIAPAPATKSPTPSASAAAAASVSAPVIVPASAPSQASPPAKAATSGSKEASPSLAKADPSGQAKKTAPTKRKQLMGDETSRQSASIDPNVQMENIGAADREPVMMAPAVAEPGTTLTTLTPPPVLKKLSSLEATGVELSSSNETPLIFDIPVTYNNRVSRWIRFFQTEGRSSFARYLERSSVFLPMLQGELTKAGLPQDLVYVVMIESGFNPSAKSPMGAMGLWQFIKPTGLRYGLKIDWWIDERRDFHKATVAAIRYMSDLFEQFESWYLVAASYNMGENGVRRLIKRYKTHNFWELAELGALPRETTDYVPKIIAAILISKAPALYGFRDLEYQMPMSYETIGVPGGTDLVNLARYLGVSEKYLKDMNPELIKGFIPRDIKSHQIRVPKGSMMTVSQYVRLQKSSATN